MRSAFDWKLKSKIFLRRGLCFFVWVLWVVFFWETFDSLGMGFFRDYFRFRRVLAVFRRLDLSKAGSASVALPLAGKSYRFLIVAYDALGDFVLSTPVFDLLRREYPGSTFDLVCSERNYSLALAYGYFDSVYKINLNSDVSENLQWDVIQSIREKSHDYVLNIFDEPDDTALVKILSLSSNTSKIFSIPIRFKSSWQKKVLSLQKVFTSAQNDVGGTVHEIPFALRMLGIAHVLGLKMPEQVTYNFPISQAQGIQLSDRLGGNRKKILLHTFGSQRNNTLNAEVIKELTLFLASKELQIFVFKNDHSDLILGSAVDAQVLTTASIVEAGALINQMDLVITTDTAIAHIATALTVPLIVLRGNERWRKAFDPLYGPNVVLVSNSPKFQQLDLNLLNLAFNKMMTSEHAEKK